MNYLDIPEHTRHSLMLYITQGYRPGRGLSYILENNLFSAVGCCDDATLAVIRPLVTWIHGFAPSLSHGSEANVAEWVRANADTSFSTVPMCYDTEEGLVKLGYPDEAATYKADYQRQRDEQANG